MTGRNLKGHDVRPSVSTAAAVTLLGTLAALAAPVAAADLAGDCCADLEQRIAELESSAVRKGNRKVSLTIAGQVNKAILLWDDGHESNAYLAGNKNDQSNLSFTGSAALAPRWTAGFDIILRIRDNLSDSVDQNHSTDPGTEPFQVWQAHWWIEGEAIGKLSVGLASRVSDTAPENDFSETGVAGYAGVQDLGGAFGLRLGSGAPVAFAWGDLYNHFNGDTANLVRYDTPTPMGFVFSASWGEDDIWDVGARYDGDGGGFKLSAAIAYTDISDTSGSFAELENATLVGSAAVLHEASGLNVLVAFGHRRFGAQALDGDGALRTPEDARFLYGKLGWIARLNGLGPTAFYGEYGWFRDFVSVTDDATAVGEIGAGALRIAGSTAEVWGAGVVQHIEEAGMQLYLGYRLHQAEFDLRGASDATVAAEPIEHFHTLVIGSKIAF